MEPHDSRDLDGVIDDVARAMTGTELARDLGAAVSSRIASGPSWAFGRRTALAAAAIATVLLVAVVLRPTSAPQRPRTVAGSGDARVPDSQPPTAAVVQEPTAVANDRPRVRGRAARGVERQMVVAPAAESVEIDPVAIEPLKDSEPTVPALVEIAPLDLDPVRISALGESLE